MEKLHMHTQLEKKIVTYDVASFYETRKFSRKFSFYRIRQQLHRLVFSLDEMIVLELKNRSLLQTNVADGLFDFRKSCTVRSHWTFEYCSRTNYEYQVKERSCFHIDC